ncbi:MotA/TolQ/ExbB proton channel family protein [Shewanella benthica]|uniref:MotA/TolQ/ExbB proton channel domain-containing protein n=1 Tax=Shewanella benthica KT99 TaxID=314608 RepID=A9DCT2_9GAMM|nr:MotA/TolQ/ExbB proton channel family protein [Shewanella benthica]EDQ00265.1 hypothetical protein KT99_07558 [Shewanella benthica KT99]
MRIILLALLLATTSLAITPDSALAVGSAEYQEFEQQVNAHAADLNLQNQEWRSRLKQGIDEVKNNRQLLAKRLSNKQSQLASLNKQLANLSEQKKLLTHDYQLAVDDMELVRGAYQKALNSLSQQWQHSPTQLVDQQRRDSIDAAKAHPGFPSLTMLNALIMYAIDDIQMTGKVSKAQAEISFKNGSVSQQELKVIGGLMAISATESPHFIVFTDRLPLAISPDNSKISEQVSAWIDNKTQLLPLDLSQGRMLPSLASEQGLADWVKRGGEVLWPILILAALGVTIALWRAVVLFYWRPLTTLTEGDANKSDLPLIKQQLLQSIRVPAAVVLANSIVAGASVEAMDQRLKQLMLQQMMKFEFGLGFIALLAAMAPMLGLLGTVSGMIETFQSLTEFGNSDPKLLSQGISKALITTQAGLLVALPLLLLHYPLKRRAQSLSLNMEQQSALLLALNIERGGEHDSR